jgi:hypothetical protein
VWRLLFSIFVLPAIGVIASGMAAAADDAQLSNLPTDPANPPIEGVLTNEGTECPTMRAKDGTLYTLMGDLRGFKPDDRVCIVPEPLDMTYCLQGTTMHVEWVGLAPCP